MLFKQFVKAITNITTIYFIWCGGRQSQRLSQKDILCEYENSIGA